MASVGFIVFTVLSAAFQAKSVTRLKIHRSVLGHDVAQNPLGPDAPNVYTLRNGAARLGRSACVTVDGRFMGGLANTVGFVNAVLNWTNLAGIKFAWPRIMPPRHHLNSTFADLFLRQDRSNCTAFTLPYYVAECPLANGRRCLPEEFIVDFAKGEFGTTKHCDCTHLVSIPSEWLQWEFDYGETAYQLNAQYWGQQVGERFSRAPSSLRSLVVHVRLGDVEDTKLGNYESPSMYIATLRLLMRVLPAGCFCPTIVTDGTSTSPDILLISKAIEELGLRPPRILDANVSARVAFDLMTRADVLLGGDSGFPRLAAVLAKRSAARVFFTTLEATKRRHPVANLPNTTELELDAVDGELDQEGRYRWVQRGVAGIPGDELWFDENPQDVEGCYQAVLAEPLCAKDYFTFCANKTQTCSCKGVGQMSMREDADANVYAIQVQRDQMGLLQANAAVAQLAASCQLDSVSAMSNVCS